jgi:hypothetical protein
VTFIRQLLGETSAQDLLVQADLAWIRNSCPPGLTMSGEMEILLALVIFDGYALFPSDRERRTR